MPSNRRRPIFYMSFALPLILADAGPRCGGSPRREPPPESSPDTSEVAPRLWAPGDPSSDLAPRTVTVQPPPNGYVDEKSSTRRAQAGSFS